MAGTYSIPRDGKAQGDDLSAALPDLLSAGHPQLQGQDAGGTLSGAGDLHLFDPDPGRGQTPGNREGAGLLIQGARAAERESSGRRMPMPCS